METDEPLRTSPTTAIALMALFTGWIVVSVWLQLRGGQLWGFDSQRAGYAMLVVAFGLPGGYMLRDERTRLSGVAFCLGAVGIFPFAFPQFMGLQWRGIPVGLAVIGVAGAALAVVGLSAWVSDPERLPVTRLKYFAFGTLAAAVVIWPMFTVFVPAIGTHPGAAIGYGLAFATFYVVQGAKTGTGSLGTVYHRHRSALDRGSDFALCAAASITAAVAVSTAVAALAGSLAIEVATFVTAQLVTRSVFDLRRPDYESVAETVQS